MSMVEQAVMRLEEQQRTVKERSAPWMVAEQLKDICRRDPPCAELVAQDLENQGMSIVEAEKQIKAFADKHKTGSFSCVTPSEAENILRKFYSLPDHLEPETPKGGAVMIDLSEFFG